MRLAPQGKEAGPHYYKKAPTSSQKVRVTNSSLALQSCKNISDLTFGGCLVGSTPEPFEGVSVLFSLSGNGYRVQKIVHLTGELFGIITNYPSFLSLFLKIFLNCYLAFFTSRYLDILIFHVLMSLINFCKSEVATLDNSFDVTATSNFFSISGYISNVKDASQSIMLFGTRVTFYLFQN